MKFAYTKSVQKKVGFGIGIFILFLKILNTFRKYYDKKGGEL